MGDDVFSKFSIGVNSWFFTCHACVGFIDERCSDCGGVKLMLPLVFFLGSPNLCRVVMCGGVLDDAGNCGGYTVTN